jgi:hypothetical protein
MREKNGVDRSGEVKITNQCRVKGGMEYGLKCEGVSLTLVISPRATDAGGEEWHVAARAGRSRDEAITVEEWGPTRALALQALGRTFDAGLSTHGLGMFDWEAVARVLRDVKAL